MSNKRKKISNPLPPNKDFSASARKKHMTTPSIPPQGTVQIHQYSGPIPSPEVLAKYNEIQPDLVERIITMAENQSNHRQEIEKIAIKEENKRANRGQFFAFVLGLIGIGGAIFLLYNNKSTEGYITCFTTIFGLLGVYIYGKQEQRKERKEARQNLEQQS